MQYCSNLLQTLSLSPLLLELVAKTPPYILFHRSHNATQYSQTNCIAYFANRSLSQ
jgi:hypothetical protein